MKQFYYYNQPYHTENSRYKYCLKKIQSTSYDSVVSIKNVEGFHPLRMKIKKKNTLLIILLKKRKYETKTKIT